MNKPSLRKAADTVENGVTMKNYEVLVDGEVIGTVFQHRAQTVHGYAGSRLGYSTERTAWGWTTPDNCGNYEMATRKAAVADLVDFVG